LVFGYTGELAPLTRRLETLLDQTGWEDNVQQDPMIYLEPTNGPAGAGYRLAGISFSMQSATTPPCSSVYLQPFGL